MDFSAINWLAVIVCVIASMISGALWYNPKTFFPAWWKVVEKGQTPGMQNMGMVWAIETGNHLVDFLLFGTSSGGGGSMLYDDKQAWDDVRTHLPNMTIYYVYLLRKGPIWSADETPEINALQEAHLANMRRLGEMGKLVLNGPLLDSFATSGEIRGIGVFKTASLEEAQELLSTDPMVKVGHLAFELHAWMVGKNILP